MTPLEQALKARGTSLANFNNTPTIYDGDTVYKGNQGFRFTGIDTPEMPSKDLKAERLKKAKESKQGRYVSLATPGERAELEAQLLELDEEKTPLKGLGDTLTVFDDTRDKPTQVSTGTELLQPYEQEGVDKYDRYLIDNPEFTSEMVSKGYAVPAFNPKAEQVDNAVKAKKQRLGLWSEEDTARELEAIAQMRGVDIRTPEEVARDERMAESNAIDALQSNTAKLLGSTYQGIGDLSEWIGEKELEYLEEERKRVEDLYGKEEAEKVGSISGLIAQKMIDGGKYLAERGEFIKENADEYYGYDSSGSEMTEKVWGNLKEGKVLDAFQSVTPEGTLNLVAESVPYMIALFNPVTFTTTYAGNVAEAKREAEEANDGKEISTGRMAAILAGELGGMLIEKWAVGKTINKNELIQETRKVINTITSKMPKALANNVSKYIMNVSGRVLAATGAEAGTEAIQEGQRIITTQAGTEKGIDTEKAIDRLGQSAVGGGLAGGAIRGTVETAKAVQDIGKSAPKLKPKKSPEELEAEKEAEEIIETETEDITAKVTNIEESVASDMSNIVEVSKQLDDLEASNTSETAKKVINQARENIYNRLAKEDIGEDVPVFGSDQEALQTIEETLASTEKVTPQLKSNINKIAKKNKLNTYDVQQMVKTYEQVSYETKQGKKGTLAYRRKLQNGSKEQQATAIRGLENFKTTQESRLEVLENAVRDAVERIKTAPNVVEDTIYVDKSLYKTTSGKPFEILKSDVQKYMKNPNHNYGAFKIMNEIRGTIKDIETIEKDFGINLDTETIQEDIKPQETQETAEKILKDEKVSKDSEFELVDKIMSKTGVEIVAKNLGKGRIQISSNKELWGKYWKEKPWANPRELADGTRIIPLNENTFESQEQFRDFVAYHELAHDYIKIKEGETRGEYETRVNNEALRKLGLLDKAYSKETKTKTKEVSASRLEEANKRLEKLNTLVTEANESIAALEKEEASPKLEKALELREELENRVKEVKESLTSTAETSNVLDNSLYTREDLQEQSKQAQEKILAKDKEVKGQGKVSEISPKKLLEVNDKGKNVLTAFPVKELGSRVYKLAQDTADSIRRNILPVDEKTERYRADQSPSRGLIYDKDGNVQENVAAAIGLAVEEYMAYFGSTLGYKTDSDIKRMLGKLDTDRLTTEERNYFRRIGNYKKNVTDSLGQAVLSNLGLKLSKDIDEEVGKRLQAELGQVALTHMMDKGYVKVERKSIDEFQRVTDNNYADSVGLQDVQFVQLKNEDAIQTAKAIYENLADRLLVESSIRKEPKKYRPDLRKKEFDIRNNKLTKVSKNLVETMNTLRGTKFTANTQDIDYVLENKELIKDYMGYERNLENLAYDSRESADARNIEIERSIEALEGLELEEMYFEWFYSKNGRYFIDSNTINPQTDKLHRFLIRPEGHEVTLDKTNRKEMKQFKLAIAQAFGYSIDKKSTEDVIEFADKVLAEDVARLEEAFNKGPGGLKDLSKQLREEGKLKDNEKLEAEHVSHTLSAFRAIKEYKESGDTFKTDISVEYDAVTSGFGIKLMQFPMLKDIYKWLGKVGVFKTDEAPESMNDILSTKGFDDSYQTLARQMQDPKIKELVEETTKNGKPINQDRFQVRDLIEEALPKPDKDGEVSSALRTLFKDPFMTFNYAAGMRSIRRSLSENIVGNLIDEMVEGKQDKLLKHLASKMKVSEDSLIKQLKSTPLDKIKIGNYNLKNILETQVNATVGYRVQKIMESNFKDFMEINKTMNQGFQAMFQAFKKEYDKRVEEEGDVSAVRKLEIIEELREVFPMIKSPLGEGTVDGIPIYSTGKSTINRGQIRRGKTFFRPTGLWKSAKGEDISGSVVETIVKQYEEAGAAGAVIPIHFIDGAMMSKVIHRGNSLLPIHDAVMPNLKDADKRVQEYNKAMLETNRDYSLLDELVSSLKRVNSKTDTSTIEIGKGETTKTYREVVNEAIASRDKVREAKDKLYSQDLSVMHMAATNSSVYNYEHKEEKLGSEDIEEIGGPEAERAYKEWKQKREAPALNLKGQRVDITKLTTGKFDTVTIKDVKVVDDTYRVILSKNVYDTKVYRFNLGETTDVSGKIEIDENVFGSEAYRNRNERANYKELGNAAAWDGQKMKRVAELVSNIGGIKAPNKEHLMSLLDKIADNKYLNEAKVYINNKASRNYGTFTPKNGNIHVNIVKRQKVYGNEKSALEVYVHELMHAITAYGLDSKDTRVAPIRRQIRHLMLIAKKKVTWRDFLPEVSIDPKAEKEAAIAMWKYIFDNKEGRGLEEFIAHGLTNERMMKRLADIDVKPSKAGKTFLEKMRYYFDMLVDMVFGNVKKPNQNMEERLMELTFELAEYNNKALKEVDKDSMFGDTVAEYIQKSNKWTAAKLEKINQAIVESGSKELPKLPENATKLQVTWWLTTNMPKIMANTELRKQFTKVLDAIGGIFDKRNTIFNVARDIVEADPLQRTVEWLGLQSDKIDQHKKMVDKATIDDILGAFDKKPSKAELEAITTVLLDTDVRVIYNKPGYGKNVMIDILTDSEALNKKITSVKKKLKTIDKENYNWNVQQSDGLGKYLATHKAGMVQNLNAHNIARGYMSEKGARELDKGVEKLVDELSTLYGLKYTTTSTKKIVASTIERDNKGVSNVVKVHNGIVEASDALFDSPVHKIKGYTKEIFEDSISVEVRPVEEKSRMEKDGYTLVEVLDHKYDLGSKRMAVYKNKSYAVQPYHRAAMRITDVARRGTSILDINYMSNEKLAGKQTRIDVRKLNIQARKVAKAMEQGKYDESMDYNITPVLNTNGDVVNYRFMMGKHKKKTMMEQDTRAHLVLGRTNASIVDKVGTKEQNKNILDVLVKDMEENYVGTSIGLNDETYIRLEANSADKQVQEVWKVLPHDVKEHIKDSGKDYLAVRKDLFLNYFGFREYSMADSWLLSWTPREVKTFVRIAEKIWQEIIKIAKVDIIIRMPIVFLGNITSNLAYSVQSGTAPWKVAKIQLDNLRNLREYLKDHREYEALVVAQQKGKHVKNKIKELERNMERNPIKPLIDKGMYQAIIEDLGADDFESNNKLSRWIDEKTENTPGWVRDGAHWLYLTEKTSYFKLMTTATQMSDFVARATEYQLQLKRGVDKETAMEVVLDTFVNYNKPPTAFEEYLNQMGLIMFTKYAKRIQRAISRGVVKHPVSFILATVGQEFLGDVDDITDQHLFTKNWENIAYNPWENLMRAVVPTVGELAFDSLRTN